VNQRAMANNKRRGMVALGMSFFVLGAAFGWCFAPRPDRNRLPKDELRTAQSGALNGALFLAGEPGGESDKLTDFFSRLHVAMTIYNPEKRARAFSAIADNLNAAQIQDALVRVEKLRISDREEVMAQLFAGWGELDPVAAIVAAQALPKQAERERATNAVLGSWIENDPAAAERWVTELSDGLLKSSAWKTLIGAVAVNHPAHALDLAQRLQLSWPATGNLAGALFDTWIGNNPQEAATHALRLPPGDLRRDALRRVAGQWARVNLQEALVWADAVPDQEFKVGAINTFGTGPIFSVLGTWMEKDSAAAVRWLGQLPDGNKKASLTASACTFLVSAGPTAQVATQLAMMLPEGSTRDNALQQFAQQFARWQPASAVTWLREQNDPEQRKAILSGLLSDLSGNDLRSALQFAQTLGVSERQDLISTQTQGGRTTWNLADPETLGDWAMHQPDNQQYLNSIAASWASTDADRAQAWLQTLSAPARDEALRGILKEALFRAPSDSAFDTAAHFQKTERWIAQLSSDQERQSSYEKLAKFWLSIDPDSARAWMGVSPLSSDARERLLTLKH
jgi:hypothetical protein